MVKIVVGAVVGVAVVVYLGFSVYFMNHFILIRRSTGAELPPENQFLAVESYMKSQVDGYVLTDEGIRRNRKRRLLLTIPQSRIKPVVRCYATHFCGSFRLMKDIRTITVSVESYI